MGCLEAGIYQAAIEFKYQLLARKLARLPVTILWERMAEDKGLFYKQGGRYYIKIHPDLDHDQAFKTVIHEAAHGRLHYKNMGDIDDPVFNKPASPIIEQARQANVNRYEAEAWDIANAWLEIAGDGPVYKRINRLMEALT